MKKIFGKALTIFLCAGLAMSFLACKDGPETAEDTPNTQETQEEQKEQEGQEGQNTSETPAYTITAPEGKESTITISEDGKTITLTPAEEKVEYTITGDFEGQIINKTEGTVIILKNANLKNTEGKAAIYGEVKTEIKAEKDTTNTIAITGAADDAYGKAAVLCDKKIEIGGAGSVTISCENGHGVKGSKVELKGSGTFVFGPAKDSAINCNDFVVKAEKTFTATLKDAKNGIKADNTISIASGTFKFENIKKVALKTDTSADDKEGETKEHKITLEGGSFTFTKCGTIYSTETDGFTKSTTVTGDFD